MLNLNSTIDLDVKTVLRWWGRELSFLVPEKIKQLVSVQQGFIIVRADSDKFILSYQFGGQCEQLATLERDSSAIAQYKNLLASDERLSKAKVILRLTEQAVIQKELALPIAAKENLHQVVGYELDRYTPFKTDQVYFVVKRLPKHLNEADQIKVLLILGVANDVEHGDDIYNLLPDRLRPKVEKIPRIIHSSLIGLVFLLLGAVIVMPVWFEYQAVNALTEKVQKVEKEAKKIKALQLETAALIEETQQLLNEKNATPSVILMLNTLSKLMKDDTWLAYLQYADGQLQIQGESPAASTLIAVLEDSEVFSNAVFVSPVTQDNLSKQEHFQITVEPTKKTNKVATDVK
ncbi:MAG: PilN domain-containing protein [Methylococcaceae bacterium]|nr:PilN domain-containing protein [Methylococcaceae bacterium]